MKFSIIVQRLRAFFVVFALLAFASAARSQTAMGHSGQTTIANPPDAQHLEKGSPVPLGVPPPTGKQWRLTFDDEFSQESAIDTAKWNGGAGGGVPWCYTNHNDVMGYSGPVPGTADNCNQFFGSPFTAPYVAVVKGTGLIVQAFTPPVGDNKYLDSSWMGLQNYGHFLQSYGYIEWSAKMPSDAHGEGDGVHTDLWCTAQSRFVLAHGDEVDVNEKVGGTGNQSYTDFVINEANGPKETTRNVHYDASDGDALSSRFHTYGLYWLAGGGTYGSLQGYMDGKPISAPFPINDFGWSAGMYCFAGWMQVTNAPPWGGSNPVGPKTSNSNPLSVRYFRAWQAK